MICRSAPCIVGVSCALLALVLPAPAAAQDQPSQAAVSLALSRTARDGTGFTPATGGGKLKLGETGSYYVYTTANCNIAGQSSGKSPEEYAALGSGGGTGGGVAVRVGASGGLGTAPASRPPLQYDYIWQADIKPVSIAIDVVTFELDWKRTDVKDGARQVTAGDHRTITLHQGDKHLLDFMTCAANARDANVFIEVQARPAEDPALANATLGYDLWLVHQAADGAKMTRHAIATGRQGEKVSFNFASIPLALDTAAADADSPFRLVVSGTLVGRVRPDGTIEIAVQPTRAQTFPGGGGGFGEGAKTFTTRPDETTSIAIPAPSGFSSWRFDAAFKLTSPRPGVSLNGDSVRITLKPFFEGMTTSLLVTPHREK